jgi:tRNA A37 threonylcarbamoyladenosine dehydratase
MIMDYSTSRGARADRCKKVAKESAGKFNPNVKLEAHHANIKDPQFNVEWFQTFNLVFNALDNLDARRHVNKMCVAADVPLIESGTTGYNGQVQVIKKVRRSVLVRRAALMASRARQDAMTVMKRRFLRASQSARYAVHLANQYIALSGPRAISYRMIPEIST